jgi:hypothetical protein
MSHFFKKCKTFSLAVVILFTTYYGCKQATDGFSELSISYNLLQGTESLPDSLKHLYHQKFSYLGKGAQAFVFVSEDKQYVIKFMRFDHLLPKFLIRAFQFIKHPYIQSRIAKSQREIGEMFNSFHMAQTSLKDYTSVCHFQNKALDIPLKIIDKIGIEHTIEKAPFIIQAYVTPLGSILDHLKEEEALNLIDQVILMTNYRMSCGIRDKDPNLLTNFGLKEGKLIEFDIGRFYKYEKPPIQEDVDREVRHILSVLWPTLITKYPQIQQLLEHKLKSL